MPIIFALCLATQEGLKSYAPGYGMNIALCLDASSFLGGQNLCATQSKGHIMNLNCKNYGLSRCAQSSSFTPFAGTSNWPRRLRWAMHAVGPAKTAFYMVVSAPFLSAGQMPLRSSRSLPNSRHRKTRSA